LSFLVKGNIKGLDYRKKKHYLLVVKKHNVEQLNLGGDMRPVNLLIILFSAILITLSCKSEITKPEEQLKSPWEMVWTADTLDYPDSYQVLMKSIWGSSADNVWTCGFHDRSIAAVWHFNGKDWRYYDLFKDVDRSALSLWKVYGFNQSNVWITGERLLSYNPTTDSWVRKPLVINFNGNKWLEHEIKTSNSMRHDVWGKDPNNVYCSGFGEINKYDGVTWKKEIIGDKTLVINGVRETSQNKYLIAVKPGTVNIPITTTYFYKHELNKWKIIDSTLYGKNFGQKLYLSNSGKLYSYGWEGIFLYDGGQWLNQNKYLAVEDMIAVNDKYVFAVGHNGQAYFSDGAVWTKIKDINIPAVYTSVWSNGKEVFIVGNLVNSVPMKTIVWHGR
jgi:hypothetical protein